MVAIVSAEESILISTYYNNNTFEITSLQIITKNAYYNSFYAENLIKDKLEYKFYFYDGGGNALLTKNPDFSFNTIIRYDQNIAQMAIAEDNQIIHLRNLSFCNYNNICEYCDSTNCTSIENALICTDCAVSGKDNFCNVVDDGICDPDCISQYECGPDCGNDCIESQFFLTNCDDYNGTICTSQQKCTGGVIYISNSKEMCCVNGVCENTQKIAAKEDNTLLQEEKKSYTWIFVVLASIIVLTVSIYFIKKKNLIVVSLFAVVVLSSGLVLIFSQTNQSKITGYVPAGNPVGNMLSRTTPYYTPIDTDWPNWYAGESIDLPSIEYCRIYRDLGSFYANVRCQGSGVADFNGVLKVCRYYSIKTSKEASEADCYHDPEFNRGRTASGTNPTPRITVACPPELDFGTEIYIDFGEHDWTGCFICEDRGGAIKISDGSDGLIPGQYHFDVYVGVGEQALQRHPLPDYANVYLGCGGVEPRPIDDAGDDSPTPSLPDTSPPDAAPPEMTVPDEIVRGEQLGYYYLNPSFRVGLDIDINKIDEVTAEARQLVEWAESQLSLTEEDIQDYLDSNNYDDWAIGYCDVFSENDEQCFDEGKIGFLESGFFAMNCRPCPTTCAEYRKEDLCNRDPCNLDCVWNTQQCVSKSSVALDSYTVRFCVNLGSTIYAYEQATNQYTEKPVTLKFAIYFPNLAQTY